MTITEQIVLWADRLRDISAMGLMFDQEVHVQAAFQAVQNLAMEMLAAGTGESLAEIEPLRVPIFSRPTPFATGDAAVINRRGEILLVLRADNNKWAMPGGALEVGETPAQGVVREALEETGVSCRAVNLVGVFDSRFCGTSGRHHLYQFLFLCEPLDVTPVPPSHAAEVLGAGWFAQGGLPRDLDPGHVRRIPEAFRVWHGDQRVFFDRQ